MDQGNSSNETKITAAIRKRIMGDKALSFGAKNVKVITIGTKVTVRGPVKTDQDRMTIEALAMQAAGVSEVSRTTTSPFSSRTRAAPKTSRMSTTPRRPKGPSRARALAASSEARSVCSPELARSPSPGSDPSSTPARCSQR